MNIHFCVDMDGWILQRIVEGVVKHIPGATYGQNIRLDADATIYFPYYNLREKGPSLDVAFFTHYEFDSSESSERKRGAWHRAVGLADLCIGMSTRSMEHLPPGSQQITIGADSQFKHFPVFGVVGREYQSGRKRMDWVHGLPGEWKFTNGEIAWEDMPAFYRSCDYIVVASENEGGPMAVKEAIAMGKPVIAPDVGWAWNYPVIRYESADELRQIVLALMPKDETYTTAREICSIVHYLKNKEAA